MTAFLRELLDPEPERLALAFTALLFGLVVGSFANVVIYRLPGREDDSSPELLPLHRAILAAWGRLGRPRRSHCPRCGAAIAARDNVPVLSFLLLGGRCRSCRSPIAARYPLVEAANGLLWAGLAFVHGGQPRTAVLLPLATCLLVLALIDLELQLLPDAITLPGAALGLALAAATSLGAISWWTSPAPPPGRPLGLFGLRALDPALPPLGALERAVFLLDGALPAAALGYGLFWLIARVWSRYVRPGVEALGQGDWKMAALLGAFFGWQGLLLTVFLATLAGSLAGGILMLLGRGDMQSKLPLGTFLGFAGIAVLFCGEPLLAWYGGLFQAAAQPGPRLLVLGARAFDA